MSRERAVQASFERPAGAAFRRLLRAPTTARAALVLAFSLAGVLLATRLDNVLHDPFLSLYSVLTISVTALVMYLAFAKYRDPTLDAPTRAWQPRVSCLVAVKNEYEVIDRCIASLFATGYPDLEVIVIDDASTDGTRERLIELERLHQQLRLLLLPESVKKKRALTHGLKYATGEILLFTDSDCVLAPDAVERVVEAFSARPDVGAISGDVRALNGDHNFLTKMQDAWYDGQFSIWKAAESVFGAVTCISGPLAAFRREAVYNFFPAWAEDTFLGKEFPFATDRQLTGYLLGSDSVGPSLKRKYADSPFVREEDYPAQPWQIAYVESARAWTVVPPTLRRLLKQQVRWKKSFIRNLFFTARFMAQGPRPRVHLLRPRPLHRRDAVHGRSLPRLPPAQR
jgi:cellulose synthase/poly-beta-1,6-N-acetylglucosamine synthase-like glycosyltransferase